ncbi:MAG TPA: hypothetical protein QF821_02990 [Candidatus Thalassarchaeaceae archaeon]|nr:hypothetical protein [Candidatus Thalassarchaeaceae archaeon]
MDENMDQHETNQTEITTDGTAGPPSSELWESPLGQSTYMFIWALASLASFAIFFKYF